MLRVIARAGALCLALSLYPGCSGPAPVVVSKTGPGAGQPPPASQAASTQPAPASGDLQYQVPEGWVSERPTSSMRLAQFQLPRADEDSADAQLVIFYFGPGQGGSVGANLERWVGQMEQPDGRSSQDRAKRDTMTVNGFNVTMLDVTGTYTAEMTPGEGDRQNKPGSRMRAAVVETPKGAYYVKLVGPEKTVNRWDSAYISFIKSFRLK